MIPCLMIPNIVFNKATNDIMNYRDPSLFEQIYQFIFFILELVLKLFLIYKLISVKTKKL